MYLSLDTDNYYHKGVIMISGKRNNNIESEISILFTGFTKHFMQSIPVNE